MVVRESSGVQTKFLIVFVFSADFVTSAWVGSQRGFHNDNIGMTHIFFQNNFKILVKFAGQVSCAP